MRLKIGIALDALVEPRPVSRCVLEYDQSPVLPLGAGQGRDVAVADV